MSIPSSSSSSSSAWWGEVVVGVIKAVLPTSSCDEVVLSLHDEDRKPLSIDDTLSQGGLEEIATVAVGGGGGGGGSGSTRSRSGGGI